MSEPATPLDAVLLEAIDWQIRLTSGTTSAHERQAFQAWLESSAEHRQAWSRLDTLLSPSLQRLQDAGRPADGLRQVLLNEHTPSRRRRQLLGSGLAILLGTGGWLAQRQYTSAERLHTGLGQRRTWVLEDGSQLTLNASTSLRQHFTAQQRLLHLKQGELIVQVAADTQRPFCIDTQQGRIRALGTRLLVRQEADTTLVLMLEHSARLTLLDGRQLELAEGQAARMGRDGILRLPDHQEYLAAWQDGRLEVRNQPLGEVIRALDAYLPGLVRLSPAAAALPVFGIFNLDQPRQALQALDESLPIQVRRYGPLTLIDLQHP